MFRTPDKLTLNMGKTSHELTAAGTAQTKAGPSGNRVRKSIGEWENGNTDSLATSTSPKRLLPKVKAIATKRLSVESSSPPKQAIARPYDRVAEARSLVTKAKIQLSKSGNLKREIKEEVHSAIDRLYQLVKDAETCKKLQKPHESEIVITPTPCNSGQNNDGLASLINEHMELIKASNVNIATLNQTLEQKSCPEDLAKAQCEGMEKLLGEVRELRQTAETRTYASAAATPSRKILPEKTSLHSVVVTAKDELDTGEEVLNKIRKTVNAKESGVTVERVRKAKDAKVIVTCRSIEERQKLKETLLKSKELHVEEIQNKDPLVILRDVFLYNTDEEVLKALKNQNPKLFANLENDDQRCDIAYKKRTRNPHTGHLVLRVSPKLWQAMVAAETVHIDLQRVRVMDQSPLVQCSLCLGYGHGRRFCKESIEKCSHCGGSHLKAKCADWLSNITPSCCNCLREKQERSDHNAFSEECPIRKKWDALARATVAYC